MTEEAKPKRKRGPKKVLVTQDQAVAAEKRRVKHRIYYGTGVKIREVMEVLEAEGYNPLESIVRALKNPKTDIDDKTRLMTETSLLPYIYPRKQQAEVNVTVDVATELAKLNEAAKRARDRK